MFLHNKKIENIILEKEYNEVESRRTGVELNVLDITTNTTTIYSSIRAGARELAIAHSTIIICGFVSTLLR